MQEKRLPPRERGLKPTHFIEVWENIDDRLLYYGCDESTKCTALEPHIDPIRFLDLFTDEYTIAIFKIYPKTVSITSHRLPPMYDVPTVGITTIIHG